MVQARQGKARHVVPACFSSYWPPELFFFIYLNSLYRVLDDKWSLGQHVVKLKVTRL